MVVLNSIEDAVAHLARLQYEPGADTEITFGGDLASIRMTFEGGDFHHSVPGDLAIGLAYYQEQIYKAARFALFGPASRQQLSMEQRKEFELVFTVEEGSSDLLAPIGVLAAALAAGVIGMTSTTLAVVIIVVVLILAGAYVSVKIREGIETTRQKKIEEDSKNGLVATVSEMATSMAAEHRQAIETVINSTQHTIVKQFEAAQESGVKEVLKFVPQAETATVNSVKFSADDIRELRRRNKRAKSSYEELTVSCVVNIDTSYNPSRLTLLSPELPGEVRADFPDDIDSGKEAMLWSSIKSKQRIFLVVGVTIINGQAKGGVILDVVSPDEVSAN